MELDRVILLIVAIISIVFNLKRVKNVFERCRNLKKLKYFYILEEGPRTTDYAVRKKLDSDFHGVYFGMFLIGIIILSYLQESIGGRKEFYTTSGVICILSYLIVKFRYSLVGINFLFYVLPIVIYILLNGSKAEKVTIGYLCAICLFYTFMTIIYPVIYLRKIDSHVALFGSVVIAFVTMFKEICSDFNYSFIGGTYAIGLFIMKVKIYYYKNIAKKKYSKLIEDNLSGVEIKYNVCKECVFYGGEDYKNRILDNKRFYKIIRSKELDKINKI